MTAINSDTIFGFIKPEIDVHILGISTITNILRDCGFTVKIAPPEVMKAVAVSYTHLTLPTICSV